MARVQELQGLRCVGSPAWILTRITCVGHLHISQRLEGTLVRHVFKLLRAHLVIHTLSLLDELHGELPYLLGAQVPS